MQRSKLAIMAIGTSVIILLYICLYNYPFTKRDTVIKERIDAWERKAVAASDPKDKAWAYAQVANIYFELKQFDKMIDYFDQALSIAPNDPAVLHQAAMGYLHAKNYDLAISTMERAKISAESSNDEKLRELVSRDYETLQVQCKLLKAQTMTGLGRRQELLRSLSQIHEGMSKDQAQEIMGQFIKGTNLPLAGQGGGATIMGYKKKKYEIERNSDEKGNVILKNCDVYRHCDDCRYVFDWAIICYENNRVAWTDFAPSE